MKAVVAAFNQEKALVGAFSVITNLWMELFEPVVSQDLMSSPLLLRDLRLLCAELTILAPAAVPLLLLLDPAVLGRVVAVVMQEVLFVLMELLSLFNICRERKTLTGQFKLASSSSSFE